MHILNVALKTTYGFINILLSVEVHIMENIGIMKTTVKIDTPVTVRKPSRKFRVKKEGTVRAEMFRQCFLFADDQLLVTVKMIRYNEKR